jgi:predicted RNA-binding protein YlqC (UPF0109 family)
MTTETEKLSDLLRDLVSSYVDHGSEIEIEAVEHPGAVYWSIRGHAEDYGKLVGKGGAHFEALRTLIAAIGEAREELHVLNRFKEPEAARRRRPSDAEYAETYDPRPARDLLCRVLEPLVGDFNVEATVRPNRDPRIPFPLFLTLTVTVRTEEDYAELAAPKQGVTLVGALGALFRARANRDGIGIQIDVARP